MTNLEALQAQCKLICNTAYVDRDVANLTILKGELDPQGEFSLADDKKIIIMSLDIVKGWVETSRSENGISVSMDPQKVEQNMIYWCGKAGVDASKFLSTVSVIEDGSNLW